MRKCFTLFWTIPMLTVLAVGFILPQRANAEDMYLVRDGKLIEKNMVAVTWLAKAKKDDPKRWGSHTVRKGETIDGIFVLDKRPQNIIHFEPNKSALGDCEFTMVFRAKHGDYANKAGGRGPFIWLKDRGYIGGWAKGSQFTVWDARMPLALKPFRAPATVNISDGKLHTMSVKRVGDVFTFTVDGEKINEQKINPDVNLIFQMHPMESRPDFAMMKLTAEKFSDDLTTSFKNAVPTMTIFKGTGVDQEIYFADGGKLYPDRKYAPEKASGYNAPTVAVSKKGTILAFAEARASASPWGHIRTVLRRSEDRGKTWGPEIDTTNGKYPNSSIRSPSPVVDSQTGRIFLVDNFFENASHANPGKTNIRITCSDDDGKTWSAPQFIPMQELKPKSVAASQGTGAGHGIQLTRGKHKGRLVVPCYGSGVGFVIYSDDKGKTWVPGGASPIAKVKMFETVCVEMPNGEVALSGQPANDKKERSYCILTDGGAKYKEGTARYAPEIQNEGLHGGFARYANKPNVLVYAGAGKGVRRRGRYHHVGTLRASYDNGKAWPFSRPVFLGGFDDCDIAVLPDGTIALVFETFTDDEDRNVAFTLLSPPPLEQKK